MNRCEHCDPGTERAISNTRTKCAVFLSTLGNLYSVNEVNSNKISTAQMRFSLCNTFIRVTASAFIAVVTKATALKMPHRIDRCSDPASLLAYPVLTSGRGNAIILMLTISCCQLSISRPINEFVSNAILILKMARVERNRLY